MKKYNLSWWECVNWNLEVKAKNEKEAKEKFFSGEYDLERGIITDGTMEDDSLEIMEIEK